MTGSEKQIEWAKKIKPVIVDMAEDEALQRLISLLNRKGATDSEINGKCATMRKMIRAAADQFESASFWIDARPNGQAPTRETVVAINKIKAAAMRK